MRIKPGHLQGPMRLSRVPLTCSLMVLAAPACEKPVAARSLPGVGVATIAPENVPARLEYVGPVGGAGNP